MLYNDCLQASTRVDEPALLRRSRQFEGPSRCDYTVSTVHMATSAQGFATCAADRRMCRTSLSPCCASRVNALHAQGSTSGRRVPPRRCHPSVGPPGALVWGTLVLGTCAAMTYGMAPTLRCFRLGARRAVLVKGTHASSAGTHGSSAGTHGSSAGAHEYSRSLKTQCTRFCRRQSTPMPKARKIRREVLFADCVCTMCEYCGYVQYVTKSLGNLGTQSE